MLSASAGLARCFILCFSALEPMGKPLGPEGATYSGDTIEGAIAEAKQIMQTVTFRFGRPRSFKIYDNNAVLVHDSGPPVAPPHDAD